MSFALFHAKKLHLSFQHFFNYRKRGSASYIVREVHSVREREREIQREKDGSDVTIVALKLAMSFALLLAKNMHLSILAKSFALFFAKTFAPQFLPSCLDGAEFTLSVAKNVAPFETVRILSFALANGVIDRGSKQQSKRSIFRLHRSSFSSKKSKK